MTVVLGEFAIDVPLPTKGLLPSHPTFASDGRFSPYLNNVRLFGGEVTNRPGLTNFPLLRQSLTTVPNGGHLHVLADRAYHGLVATRGNVFYYNTSTLLWTSIIAGASPSITLTGADTDPWSFTTIFDDACLVNGINGVYRWRSPTVDIGGGVGKAVLLTTYSGRYLTAFANRLVLVHTRESSVDIADRVRWSAYGDHTVWSPGANVTSGFNDTVDWPGPITGMAVLGGINYIFKREFIISMQESGLRSPSFFFRAVVDGTGCIAGRSIVRIGGALYFLGHDNVYRWDAVNAPAPIGAPIQTELFSLLNNAAARAVHAFHHPTFNEYWLCVPTGESTWPNVAYVYNYAEDSWARNEIDATTSLPFKEVLTSPIIDSITFPIDDWVTPIDSGLTGADTFYLVLGGLDFHTYRLNDSVTTDLAAVVTAVFDTSDRVLQRVDGRVMRNATITGVVLRLRNRGSVALNLSVSTNGGGSWHRLGTRTFNPPTSSNLVPFRFPAWVTGPSARLRLSATAPFALLGYSVECIERGPTR